MAKPFVDAAINVVPDALNLVLFPDFSTHTKDEPSFGRAKVGEMYDELSSQIDPNYAGNPIPRIETSAIKYDFRSEMMRRDINGKLDGDRIKAGDAITTTASIAAPWFVGKVLIPAESPQTLGNLNVSKVYRVQGGRPPKVSEHRISIGKAGEMVVTDKERKVLFVTFDDYGRVKIYQAKNRLGGEIISFEVDSKLVREIRATAVYEKDVRQFPDAPIIADPTKTKGSYGLSPEWIEKLIKFSKPGTGKIEK